MTRARLLNVTAITLFCVSLMGCARDCPVQVCPACVTQVPPEPLAVEMTEEWWHLPGSIHFASSGSEVDARSRLFLEEAVRMARDRQDVRQIRIEGHTDERGNDADNVRLSEERARAVGNLLTGMGVPTNMITYQGFGAAQPLATGGTEQDHMLNRRVEFSLLMARPVTSGGQR